MDNGQNTLIKPGSRLIRLELWRRGGIRKLLRFCFLISEYSSVILLILRISREPERRY